MAISRVQRQAGCGFRGATAKGSWMGNQAGPVTEHTTGIWPPGSRSWLSEGSRESPGGGGRKAVSFRRARLTPKGVSSLEGGGCWERNCGAALRWSWGRGANKEEMFGQGSSPACGVCVRFRSRLAAGGNVLTRISGLGFVSRRLWCLTVPRLGVRQSPLSSRYSKESLTYFRMREALSELLCLVLGCRRGLE